MRLTARGLNRRSAGNCCCGANRSGCPTQCVAWSRCRHSRPPRRTWNRLTGFDPASLDDAFAGHEVIKATLVRITLPAVHAGDYRVFHQAMGPTLRATLAALQTMVKRYLAGFGPASVANVAQFALVQQARVKRALVTLASDLEELEGPDGKEL